MRYVIGILVLLVAVIFGVFAYALFSTCLWPWLRSPDTMHVTWIFAGFRFSGWSLFVPFLVAAGLALGTGCFGFWIMRRRD